MKKASTKNTAINEMRSEYDFAGKKGERGKYYEAYRQGHQARIQKADGSTVVQYFSLKDGAVMLEPEVQLFHTLTPLTRRCARSLL